jgi:3-phenylpropionate/cinnamic acid dioxygenase small subunit
MAGIERLLLLAEVSDFLFEEAELLSDRKYEAWLDRLSHDLTYRVFILRNLSGKEARSEYFEGPLDVSWFHEGKETIAKRVEQIRTHQHWAEEPPSRTTRYLTNIRIQEHQLEGTVEWVRARCNFMVNRNRNEADDQSLCGHRVDVLEKSGGGWKVKQRKIYLNQSTMLMGNLSFFI